MNEAWRLGLVVGLWAADVLVVVFIIYLATEIAGWVRRWWR